MQRKLKSGFTFLEVIISLAIMAVLATVILSTLINFRKSQAIEKDAELVVQLINQAHNQTLSSKNSSVYGVHFETTQITLFTGASYNVSDPNNQSFILNGTDTIVTITLASGGTDVVFKRLSGETSQNGTITLSSPSIGKTKTVTIYKTGLVESQ